MNSRDKLLAVLVAKYRTRRPSQPDRGDALTARSMPTDVYFDEEEEALEDERASGFPAHDDEEFGDS